MGRWESRHAFWITRLACSRWSDREISALSPHWYFPAGVPEKKQKDTQEEENLGKREVGTQGR